MTFLIFLGVLIAGALVVVLCSSLSRRGGPIIPMVYLGTPAGFNEQQLWLDALKSASIPAHVENPYWSFPNWRRQGAFATDIWVREEDYAGARGVLGFDYVEPARRKRIRPKPLKQGDNWPN